MPNDNSPAPSEGEGNARVWMTSASSAPYYRKKAVVIQAMTFAQMVEYGRSCFPKSVHGEMPWSLSINGHAITHENDQCYLITTLEGLRRMTPNDMLVIGIQGEIYPCKLDIFAATYEAVSPFALGKSCTPPAAGDAPERTTEHQSGEPVSKPYKLPNDASPAGDGEDATLPQRLLDYAADLALVDEEDWHILLPLLRESAAELSRLRGELGEAKTNAATAEDSYLAAAESIESLIAARESLRGELEGAKEQIQWRDVALNVERREHNDARDELRGLRAGYADLGRAVALLHVPDGGLISESVADLIGQREACIKAALASQSEIESLRLQLAEREKDAERLDWCEREARRLAWRNAPGEFMIGRTDKDQLGVWFGDATPPFVGNSLREAIDTALTVPPTASSLSPSTDSEAGHG